MGDKKELKQKAKEKSNLDTKFPIESELESDSGSYEEFSDDDFVDSMTNSGDGESVLSADEGISGNYSSVTDSEAGSSSDEGFVTIGNGPHLDNNREDESKSSDSYLGAEESDSSEDEVAPRNTIGDVPLIWYEDEPHIGYDIKGKKIKKREKQGKLGAFLDTVDDPKNWRKIRDEVNDEDVELTKEEIRMIDSILKGRAPHAGFDPHPDYVDFFHWDDAIHPLSNAPEPKRRFIPSRWEHKKVVQLVRRIRSGTLKFDKSKEEPDLHLIWQDDLDPLDKGNHLAYIAPPKTKLPGHEESYNPSLEYIPDEEEISSYQLMYEEDRPKFIPRRYASLRSIPAYENALKDSFERCLDLYLCPRGWKKRLNIDPESLKPKLPPPKDLRPYPETCYLEYRGHKGAVTSISVGPSGQWIASGSSDGTVRVWEVDTGRCLRLWEVGEAVHCVTWNPILELPILAVSVGPDVLILNTDFVDQEDRKKIEELLQVQTPPAPDECGKASVVSWVQDDQHKCIRLKHFKTVTSVEWHRKGDYFSTVMPAGESRSVHIHQLSKKITQRVPFKLHGLPVTSIFHPTRSIFFISTKKNIRVYDLLKQKLIKKLDSGLREISSIAIHPGGDNLIVGSKEGKLCWFDMDLSSKPYRTLKCHDKDITNVAFHRLYPLLASSSDNCDACVFHGMVYADLNQNPLIVPLKVLRGHSSSNGRGVLDCKFHPRQPWLFTAGADSVIRLYCH